MPVHADLHTKELIDRLRYQGYDDHLDDCRLVVAGRWGQLQHPLSGRGRDMETLGAPGLWKSALYSDVRCFDLLLTPPNDNGACGEDWGTLVREQVSWALSILSGAVPLAWTAPTPSELESLVPTGGLNLQVGPHIRRGVVSTCRSRFAVSFPILDAIPESLSPARRGWLRACLSDANRRWRIVRIGFDSPEEKSASAEIDMTGAPQSIVSALLPVGLAILHRVVEWLIPGVELIADPKAPCVSFEKLNHTTFINAGDTAHERSSNN